MPSNYDIIISFLIYYWFGAWRQNIEEETSMKNNHVLAIRMFNWRVVKKEHDRVSFQILHPTIHSTNL